MSARPRNPESPAATAAREALYLKQVAEAAKYLMACSKTQTESALRVERLTNTMKTLTWVMAVLTLIASVCTALAVFH